MKINFEPISTNIRQVVPFKNGYLILEDYYEFEGTSNLYFIEDDVYTEFIIEQKFIIAFLPGVVLW